MLANYRLVYTNLKSKNTRFWREDQPSRMDWAGIRNFVRNLDLTLRHLVIDAPVDGFRLVRETRNKRKRVHKKGVEVPQNWLDIKLRQHGRRLTVLYP